MPAGRPRKEFNKKLFIDLIGLGCSEEEICWVFRDDDGVPVDVNTLSRWCKRTFGMNFSEYSKQNRYLALKTQLRKNQFELSKRSASMAIFLGKNYLGQVDSQRIETRSDGALADLIEGLKESEIDTSILESGTESEGKE